MKQRVIHAAMSVVTVRASFFCRRVTMSQIGLVHLRRMALTAHLRVAGLDQTFARRCVRVMAFSTVAALHWFMRLVTVRLKRIVTTRANCALVIHQRERIGIIRRRMTIGAGGTFHRRMNRRRQQRLHFRGVRHMAFRTIFITDRIARVLLRKRRVTLGVTARAQLCGFLNKQTLVIAAVHIMACRAPVRHRLVLMRAFKLFCVVAFDTQVRNRCLQQALRFAAMRVVTIETLARASGFMHKSGAQVKRVGGVARRAQRRTRVFESERADFAVRQMAFSALPFGCRFVREFATIFLRVMALEAVFLFAEAGSAFHLGLRAGMVIQRHQSQHREYGQQHYSL